MAKNKGGRPLKFKNAKEIEVIGLAYFKKRTDENLPLTVTGLALALGVTRQFLMEYQAREEFGDTIKKLKSICEDYAEIRMFTTKNAAGPIFALKNFGWKDTQIVVNPADEPKAQMQRVRIEKMTLEELDTALSDKLRAKDKTFKKR